MRLVETPYRRYVRDWLRRQPRWLRSFSRPPLNGYIVSGTNPTMRRRVDRGIFTIEGVLTTSGLLGVHGE